MRTKQYPFNQSTFGLQDRGKKCLNLSVYCSKAFYIFRMSLRYIYLFFQHTIHVAKPSNYDSDLTLVSQFVMHGERERGRERELNV